MAYAMAIHKYKEDFEMKKKIRNLLSVLMTVLLMINIDLD